MVALYFCMLELLRRIRCLLQKTLKAHLGFIDDTTACIDCMEDKVFRQGFRIYKSFNDALQESPNGAEIKSEIMEWATVSAQVTRSPEEICIARSIVSVSERRGLPVDEVIQETVERGSGFLLAPDPI